MITLTRASVAAHQAGWQVREEAQASIQAEANTCESFSCDCFALSHDQILIMSAITAGVRRGVGVPDQFTTDDLLSALGFPQGNVCSSDLSDVVAAIVRSARRG